MGWVARRERGRHPHALLRLAPGGYDLPARERVAALGCDRFAFRRFDVPPVLAGRDALAGFALDAPARGAARFVEPFEPAAARLAGARVAFAAVRLAVVPLVFAAVRLAVVPLAFAAVRLAVVPLAFAAVRLAVVPLVFAAVRLAVVPLARFADVRPEAAAARFVPLDFVRAEPEPSAPSGAGLRPPPLFASCFGVGSPRAVVLSVFTRSVLFAARGEAERGFVVRVFCCARGVSARVGAGVL